MIVQIAENLFIETTKVVGVGLAVSKNPELPRKTIIVFDNNVQLGTDLTPQQVYMKIMGN